MKFTKLPVTIDAIEVNETLLRFKADFDNVGDPGSHGSIPEWILKAFKDDVLVLLGFEAVIIVTAEGRMRGDKGDWIIRGVNGELYPCKPDVFLKTYRVADEATQTCSCPIHGSWIAVEDYNRNVKALDVALNGQGGAKAPRLIDILSQVECVVRKRHGVPLLLALVLPPMTDSLREVLGTPVHTMIPLVRLLRADDPSIESRYEAEQAALLHWMLTFWFKHGDDWRQFAGEEIGRMKERFATKQLAAQK